MTVLTTLLVAALLQPISRTWSICGGPSGASPLCANVNVQVDGRSTLVRVKNVSLGSWVLATVGFEGISAAAGTFTTAVSATTGPWWQRTPDATQPASWQRFDDTQFGGGVNLDFGIDNGNGISNGIASGCAPMGSLPGGNNRLWMTPVAGCANYSIANATLDDGWVESRLTTDATWDPRSDDVSVFFKGMNGPRGVSYECLVGNRVVRGDCSEYEQNPPGDAYPTDGVPPGSVVPEPRTYVLMATGVLPLLLPGVRRRVRELASR